MGGETPYHRALGITHHGIIPLDPAGCSKKLVQQGRRDIGARSVQGNT
ncbi:MAG: hypothetical protein VST68_08100 [Nitrospirota bacterium]|nr:hypothetical protein [Nitrospirota bacterium]